MSEYPWNETNITFSWFSSLYNPFKDLICNQPFQMLVEFRRLGWKWMFLGYLGDFRRHFNFLGYLGDFRSCGHPEEKAKPGILNDDFSSRTDPSIFRSIRPGHIGGRCHPERDKLGQGFPVCYSIVNNETVR